MAKAGCAVTGMTSTGRPFPPRRRQFCRAASTATMRDSVPPLVTTPHRLIPTEQVEPPAHQIVLQPGDAGEDRGIERVHLAERSEGRRPASAGRHARVVHVREYATSVDRSILAAKGIEVGKDSGGVAAGARDAHECLPGRG